MNKKAILAVFGMLLIQIWLNGCVTYHVWRYQDPFEGYVKEFLGPYSLSVESGAGGGTALDMWDIKFQRFRTKQDPAHPEYGIFLLYEGSDYFPVPKGATLSFLVDGKLTRLSGDGTGDRVKAALVHRGIPATVDGTDQKGRPTTQVVMVPSLENHVEEQAYYDVSLDFLKQLAVADSVSIQLRGKHDTVQKTLDAKLLTFIGQWIIDLKENKIQ